MTYVILTNGEIINVLGRFGISANAVLFADESYILPEQWWVQTTFAQAWLTTMSILNTGTYRPLTNDCDDFARLCAAYAQLLNNATILKLGITDASLAFGEFWFQSATGPHAINAYLYPTGVHKEIGIGFIEPQTGQTLNLTPDEISSCSLLRL